MTGYSQAEAIGRNCRFLQGTDTDPAAVAEIGAAIRERRSTSVTVLNYRRDGSTFWNQLSLSPVFHSDGTLANFVGVQVDVTTRVANERFTAGAMRDAEAARELAVHAQAESEFARADAERARFDSEHATRRLVQMAQITEMLTSTLDVSEALTRLTAAVVPAMGDWCVVNLVDEIDRSQQIAAQHRDAARDADMQRYLELQPTQLTDASPTNSVLAGGPPTRGTGLTTARLETHVDSAELVGIIDRLGAASYLVVPLRAPRRTHGALTLVNMPGSPDFTAADLDLLTEVGRRAGLAIDNARLYAREHEAAISLQRSLLPTLPAIDGLTIQAEYLAGARTAEVGGDWYDVLPLADGTVGLAIGDVMGHDLAAAAAMGQLRSVLRSYAWEGGGPAGVLARLDRLVQGLGMAQLATCCYLRLERRPDGSGRLTWSNAGHPPPLLVGPDGSVRLLDGALSPPIGVPVEVERVERTVDLAVGATLLLYTDGLVEDRRRDLDAGLAELSDSAAQAAAFDLEELIGVLLAPVLERGLDDDVAVLAVRLL
jgi:PAS domain S-box-containing protein